MAEQSAGRLRRMVESSVSPKDDTQAGGFGDILRGKLRANCGVVNLTIRNAYTIDTYHAKKNLSISYTWPAARAENHPQILLRSHYYDYGGGYQAHKEAHWHRLS